MNPVRLRRDLWKMLWWCCVMVVVVGVCSLLAQPPPHTRPRSLPRREPPASRKVKVAATKAKSVRLPEVKETLQKGPLSGVLGLSVVVDRLAYGSQVVAALPLHHHTPAVLGAAHYVHRVTPPPPLVMGEKNASWSVEEEEEAGLGHVRDYFTYLNTPQAGCRKLVTMGGLHKCGDVTDKLPDGSKVVCMDAALGLPPAADSRTCLTLSFGINVDVSFDEAVSKFNCEVHMFDLIDHAPATLLSRFKHVHFHNVGLAEARRQNFYLNIQHEIPVDTLSGILLNHTFIGRSLTILKIDIEDEEWKVLRKMVQEPVMDIIGQIAIEIHAKDLTTLPPQKHLAYVRQRYDVLKALEGRGFRKVAYWDNKGSATYSDSSGYVYNTCGEVHYVNSNWYNETFKQRYKDIGFEFR